MEKPLALVLVSLSSLGRGVVGFIFGTGVQDVLGRVRGFGVNRFIGKGFGKPAVDEVRTALHFVRSFRRARWLLLAETGLAVTVTRIEVWQSGLTIRR